MIVMRTVTMTTDEYLRIPPSNQYEELEFGRWVREPPPTPWHQDEMIWLHTALAKHVRARNLGSVKAHVDVVLDDEEALVVAPDVLVLLGDRLKYLRARVWGPPNLAIEIASPSTARRDRTTKLEWYRTYGVQECWLVDDERREITVCYLDSPEPDERRIFRGDEVLESPVLPDFQPRTCDLFDPDLPDTETRKRYRARRLRPRRHKTAQKAGKASRGR